VDSPVGCVVGQVLPGREFTPGAHVEPGDFRVARHHVAVFVVTGDPFACRRLDVVVPFSCYPRLKRMTCLNPLACACIEKYLLGFFT